MRFADVSIRRPVFAVMLIAALLVFGLLSYPRIGVDLFPNVEFPVITVTALYPGGDPETMESKVADPIEEAINTLSGIKALRSTNLEGVSQVVIEFELEVAVDQAMQDVRDKVSGVLSQLPEGTEAPVIQKFDVGAAPIMAVALSGKLSPRDLTELADKVVKERIQRVTGVGGVDLVGGREREIRVLVDPAKLAGVGMTVQDVSDAIRSQNLALPAGSFERGTQEITVKTKGEVKTAEEVAQILLPGGAGSGLRVRDVAQVIDGMEDARSASYLDGTSAVSLVVRKQSGTNTVAVAHEVSEALKELRPRITKAGATLTVPTDNAVYIERSIEDVQFDLMFGAVLAVVIILLFLRDLRATIISAVAIPTSVIASFAFMQWMDFTFNNMTMLALSLSIGILIDDAIVVIENIHRRLEQGESPMDAAANGTAQIFLAVVATTSSILAVFVPVAFMKGIVGRFFFQFGLTVSVAVAVSMLVSFTLTPMLSSRFLRPAHGDRNFVSAGVERFLVFLDNGYGRMVGWALSHRAITVVIAAAALFASFFVVTKVKTEFLPPEDRAQFNVNVELPTGTSLSATEKITEAVAKDMREHAPGLLHTFTTIGGGAQGQVNLGQIQMVLTPSKQRQFKQHALMAWVRARLKAVTGANITVQEISAVGGGAFRSQPVQFYVRGSDMDQLVAATDALKNELGKIKGFVDLDTTYRGGKPELSVQLDRESAASLGVPVASVATTIRALMAGDAVSEIKDGINVYDITVQLPEAQQAQVETLGSLQVRSVTGQLIDLSNVVSVTPGEGPSQIERQARQRQITVLAGLEGVPLGEATKLTDAAAKRTIPPELVTGFVGMADTMKESFAYMGIALFLAVVLVYMILAAQFDSFVQPLTIMLSLPLSVVGAFGGLFLTGKTLNIFSMIGVIMLMGLVTKNAILLVDFANQLREEGASVRDALVKAGIMRLRPITMTTAAMVFGMLPVALAISEGGDVRAPMAICVIGGLITSTLLTLIVVPVAYSLTESMIGSGLIRWINKRVFSGARPAGHDATTVEAGAGSSGT
ncbi:MAG TPA: efflux RND transporter permease subunit [Polyangiales bacterium]|nr:efflux RND transporter permease subunit [Polyangiales bacterium]